MKLKQKAILFLIIGFLIISAPFIYAEEERLTWYGALGILTGTTWGYWGIKALDGLSGITRDDFSSWYDVQDWERQVCSNWGGVQESTNAVSITEEITLSQLAVTISATKTPIETEGGLKYAYEIAWFVMPTEGEVATQVRLLNADRSDFPGLGSVGDSDGSYGIGDPAAAQYKYIEPISQNASYAKLEWCYGENCDLSSSNENLIVPIIET